MKSITLLLVFLAFRTSARPLHFEQPYWELWKDPIPTPEDDPYGPMERNSWVGNNYHPGDWIHGDDRWPDLVPPAAVVRRLAPTEVTSSLPMAAGKPAYLWPPLFGHGPYIGTPSDTTVKDEVIVVTTAPAVQEKRLAPRSSVSEYQSPTSATTVQSSTPTSTEEDAALYTGAQQWQQYGAHETAVSPVPTRGMLPVVRYLHPTSATTVQSSDISTTGNLTALSTGAQQWQAYWDHDAANLGALTDEDKFDLFAKAVAMLQHFATALIKLSELLAQLQPQNTTQNPDTKDPGTAMIAMCDIIGRLFSEHKIQEAGTQGLGTAIITTCRWMTQLFPQRKIQERNAAPIDGDAIAIITDFFLEVAGTQSLDAQAIHGEVIFKVVGTYSKLNKTQNRDAGAIGDDNITNITTLRGQLTHHKIENRTSTRSIEKHAEYANISPHNFQYQDQVQGAPSPLSSPSALAYRTPLTRRETYMFTPFEVAYSWLNGIYTRITDQHPRYPYEYPDQQIYGCIYTPSWDNVAKAKIICPPDGQEGTVEKRYIPDLPEQTEAESPAAASYIRDDPASSLAKNVRRTRWSYYKDLFFNGKAESAGEAGEPALAPAGKRNVSAGIEKRSIWSSIQPLFFNGDQKDEENMEVDDDVGDKVAITRRVDAEDGICDGLSWFYRILWHSTFGGCGS